MAELADALDLGSSGATRTGSIPASRTNNNYLRLDMYQVFFVYGFIYNINNRIYTYNVLWPKYDFYE